MTLKLSRSVLTIGAATCLIVACGGSSTSTNPTEPNINLIAPSFPSLAEDGTVLWPFSPKSGNMTVEVAAFATIPAAKSGRQARVNDVFFLGDQLFALTEQDGLIYDISNGTTTLWFDVAAAILASQGRVLDTQSLFHGGLRSAAFHPDFTNNGKLYTSVMEQRPADPENHHYLSDLENPLDADGVVVEWTVDPSTMVVDPNSYREVFRVSIPEYDHPIKQIEFNPYATSSDEDYGLLYIGHGDGSVLSITARGGQLNDALGKVLRIDPLQNGDEPFSIPPSNPFVNDDTMIDAVYSIGHRNPHTLAFAPNGTLVVAEPGRDNIDEINIIVPGGDYGWAEREGHYVELPQGTVYNGIAALPADDADTQYIYPVAAYGHEGTPGVTLTSRAIVGGPIIESSTGDDHYYLYSEFVGTGDLYYSSLNDMQDAVTQGDAEQLSVAPTYQANLVFDHDNDASTPAIAYNSMLDIIKQGPNYDQSGRTDTRLGIDANNTVYISNKRNGIIYSTRITETN